MKEIICTLTGIGGAIIAGLFGGWSTGLATLLIFMGIDYVTGLIVAGVFKKSNKSKSGALESKAGFKGLCRKAMILLFVAVAFRLDLAMGTNYLRDAVIIAFMVNEVISIIENAGLMGAPVPKPLQRAVDLLNKNAEADIKATSTDEAAQAEAGREKEVK